LGQRQVLIEVDLLGGHRPQPAPAERDQLSAQLRARLIPGLDRDERLDQLAGYRVRLPDHADLRHRRVLLQHALHLEREDQVASRLDHIVRADDEPVIARRRHRNAVTAERGPAACRSTASCAMLRPPPPG
jgi:hypothetical protein